MAFKIKWTLVKSRQQRRVDARTIHLLFTLEKVIKAGGPVYDTEAEAIAAQDAINIAGCKSDRFSHQQVGGQCIFLLGGIPLGATQTQEKQ